MPRYLMLKVIVEAFERDHGATRAEVVADVHSLAAQLAKEAKFGRDQSQNFLAVAWDVLEKDIN